ncbi:MAG: apolipoprotein N-acyltransferase, partial [Candidatus Omnitrophica bacterium]|nr:apolipoprotein N-acyltransferase [Candidatus Omnitrophota bacterium]
MLRQVTTGLRVKGLGLRRDLLFCVLSGILLALPFSKINLWIFGWFGFVPLFFVLQNKSRFQAFLFSYLTGVIFWLITVYWLVHVTLAGMILMSLYLALYFGIFGLLIAYTPYPLPLTPCIYVSSIWVLLEYIRSYLMTGFPWALLGYSQSSNLPIIQIADITGVWGVSFVVMMVNVALYQGTRYKVQGTGIVKKYWLPIVFLAGVLVYGYCSINCYSRAPLKPLKKIKVSVAQGNIPQELKWDPNAKDYIIDKYLDIAKAAAKKDPDLIIMPEATMPVVLEQSPDVLDKVTNTVKENNIPLLFGTVTLNHGNFYNSALLISPKTGFIQQYNKLHLVPFGEFIPLRNTLTFLENMIPIGDFSAGKNYTIFKLKDARFSVLICFEDMFPEVSRGFVNAGTGFLVNMTNDAWFKDTSSPFQHLQGSIFRAVENRRFLVRSANTGVSAFIDRSGKVYSTLSDV